MIARARDRLRKGLGKRPKDLVLSRLESELPSAYEYIFQVFGEADLSLKVLQQSLKRCTRRGKVEAYERYFRLWFFRIITEVILQKYPRFFRERDEGQSIPYDYLSLEEKLALILRDRMGFETKEIVSLLQITEGRLGRLLTYAREGVARKQGWMEAQMPHLQERIKANLETVPNCAYGHSMREVKNFVARASGMRLDQVEIGVRQTEINPLLSSKEGVRLADLSWQYKLGLEASLLAVVGLFVVIVIPWVFDRTNTDALLAGRFAEAFQTQSVATEPKDLEEISTDRLLASADSSHLQSVEVNESTGATEEDEFANMEFPDGDSYEVGSAPVAPSRQQAAVFRLIVQSPSPRDLIPTLRTLFADKQVKERDRSGKEMPGGVYFDGVTNIESYSTIAKEVQKLGITKTYANPGSSRNPRDRARVIVWVQQI